jgi:hypothetical protein
MASLLLRSTPAVRNGHLACLGITLLLGVSVPGCSRPLDGSYSAVGTSAATTTDVRRICLQNGIAGLGGGDVVRLEKDDGSGKISIQTLTGASYSIAALSDAGQPTLCAVTPGPMQVCPADSTHTGDVAVLSTLSGTVGGTGHSAGTVARGTPLLLWDHVHDGGGKGASLALVTIGGQERFVPASEVCLAESYPTPSNVTTALQMRTTWQDASGQMQSTQAAASVYRPRTPAMITRLVVHNTEATFDSTMQLFTSGSAGTSAHVVLDRDGTLYRVVEDQYAAYHAGGHAMGNYNDATLGVEVVAYSASEGGGGTDASFMTAAQSASLVSLLRAWMAQYDLQLSASTLQNSSSAAGYADLEYAAAALTIHRLTKADRGTDCPLHLWADSAAGDEAFFQWRLQTFGTQQQDAGAPAPDSGSSTSEDAGAPAADTGSSTPEEAGTPAADSGSSSTSASCKTDGDCNPGTDGSGQICVNGTCVPGCNANWECPGSTTCVSGQCQ